MKQDDPKTPLEYRNYADDRPQRRGDSVSVALGLISGIITVGVCGAAAALNEMSVHPPIPGKHFNMTVCVFALLAIATGFAGVFTLRGRRRRFFLGGFLLGIALMSIIEGICFAGGLG